MKTIFVIYVLAAALATSLLVVSIFLRNVAERRRRQWTEPLQGKYLRIVVYWLLSDGGPLPAFPLVKRRAARRALAEAVSGLSVSTYGMDLGPLRRLVEHHRLDRLLVRDARRARGCRRARILQRLSGLPLDPAIAGELAPFTRDGCRSVRFYALLVRLAADPAESVRLLALHPDPLSPLELSEVIALLRRGVLPIAYEPLLMAPERNLRMLGLAIVRQFGVVEAAGQLRRMAAEEDAGEVAVEALYTLCALHRPMSGVKVRTCFGRLDRSARKALIRFMAHEGYAVRGLEELFLADERPYFESLVNTYKRTIACS